MAQLQTELTRMQRKTANQLPMRMLQSALRQPVRTLVYLAIASRLIVLALALLSHRYISDYDASAATILELDVNNSISDYPFDRWLRPLVSVYLRWDAFFFLHIAEEGYVYEQEHAFFPMVPWLMRAIAATSK